MQWNVLLQRRQSGTCEIFGTFEQYSAGATGRVKHLNGGAALATDSQTEHPGLTPVIVLAAIIVMH